MNLEAKALEILRTMELAPRTATPFEYWCQEYARRLRESWDREHAEEIRVLNEQHAFAIDQLKGMFASEREKWESEQAQQEPVGFFINPDQDCWLQVCDEDDLQGCEKVALFTRPAAQPEQPCPRCNGTGKIEVNSFVDPSKKILNTCQICKGKGTLNAAQPDNDYGAVDGSVKLKWPRKVIAAAQPMPQGMALVSINTLDSVMRDCEHGSRIWKTMDALLREYRLAASKGTPT